MPKIIWIDIDDTISKSYELLVKIFNPLLGLSFRYEQITCYYLENVPELAHIKFDWHGLYQDILSNKHDLFEPIEWSRNCLKKIKDSGKSIVAITARQPIHRKNTENWLQNHFTWLVDGVHFLGTLETYTLSKAETCKNLWVEYMIEDNIDHCLDLANHGVRTYLIEQPWNCQREEKHPLITRVKNWEEILHYL